jgi:hypothetical protein
MTSTRDASFINTCLFVMRFVAYTDIEGVTFHFLDGAVSWNNPTRLADELVRENPPFGYDASKEKLIVVSLGTGGVLFKNYNGSQQDKVDVLEQAVKQSRVTADQMHLRYKQCDNVEYYRFDPDAVGRHEANDAAAFNDIENEMENWFDPAKNEELQIIARKLLALSLEVSVANVFRDILY